MTTSTPISMPLNVLTKQQLRQSDDSLPLGSISQCRDEPPTTEGKGEHALPLKHIPSLENRNSKSNFNVGGSWLTKSNSLHSSSSSVYSSLEPNDKRQCAMTTTNSETSVRSSIISQSQESAKSMVSSVGVTSVSDSSHYSQKSAWQQKQKRRSEGLKKVLSFSSLRKKDNLERSPFKWLCRRSDASVRQSTSQLKLGQEFEEDQSRELFHRKYVEMQPPQIIPPDLGPVIAQRMERLEEKIDTFIFSGLSSAASKSTRNTADSASLNPDNKIIEGPSQTLYTQPQRIYPTETTDTKNQLKILTAEINHLTKSNNKLSSCIDALGSSGLIDLLEMLSCSLERLHAAINSLREEQRQRQQQTLVSEQESREELREKRLDSQMDIIQRLGFLLGQREEQLKHERKLNQSYRKNIEGLEGMIRVLEEEWDRAMPLMARSGMEGVSDVIGKLSRGCVEQ